MLKGVSLTDLIQVPSERQITDAGQMIVPCAFARTGEQVYSAGQLGLQDEDADKPIKVMRDEADVFDESSMQTFRSAPVTIGHPKCEDGLPLSVTAENAKELQVGVLEGMPTRDEDTLTGTLVIARQDAIDLIEDGTKELSAGYTCDLEMVDGEDGEPVIYQRNIRANHIAIVEKGRAGSMCAIADESEEASESQEVSDADDKTVEDQTLSPSQTALARKGDAPEGQDDGGDGIGRHDSRTFDEEALARGVKVEMEHTDDTEVATSIAKDHLAEDPDYYEKLAQMESHDEAEVKDEVVEPAADDVAEAVSIEDQLETAKTSVASLTDELEAAKAENAKLQDELDSAVTERVETILVAKDLTDLDDFSGKSVVEIKEMVVADLMPNLNLEGKSEAYVSARFDVITEDAENGETPLGRLLREQQAAGNVHDVADKPVPGAKVAEARKRSIERHKSKS